MPLAAYSPDNPAASDPWPIESTLAPIALGGDQMQAQGMLDSYRLQRQAASNVYAQNLAGQHDFAQQQLAQQLYEARLKAFPDIAKMPGGARFIQQGGAPGLDLGGDPNAIGGLANAGDLAQAATNFEHAGSGFNSFAQGGLQVNPAQIPGMAGVSGTLTDPALVRAATIRANAQLAGDRLKAADGDRGSYQMPPDPDVPGMIGTVRPNKGESYQQFKNRMIAEGRIPGAVKLPQGGGGSGGVTPAIPAAPSDVPVTPGGAPPPASPQGKTGLQPRGGATTPAQNASPGGNPIERALSDHVERVVRVQNPQAYADIMAQAARNGNKIQMLKDGKGNIVGIQGATQKYTQ